MPTFWQGKFSQLLFTKPNLQPEQIWIPIIINTRHRITGCQHNTQKIFKGKQSQGITSTQCHAGQGIGNRG